MDCDLYTIQMHYQSYILSKQASYRSILISVFVLLTVDLSLLILPNWILSSQQVNLTRTLQVGSFLFILVNFFLFALYAKQKLQQSDTQLLQASEARNQAIFSAIPDLMIRVRGDGTYLEIVGQDRLQGVHDAPLFLIGTHVRDSLPPDLADLRMTNIQKALQTGLLQIYEQRLLVEGKEIFEEVRVMVVGPDEVLIIVRDITERKKQEELLERRVQERTLELAQANAEIQNLNQKLKEDNRRMSAELDVARQIQQMILPKPEELENITELDIAGFMEPADEVGGDYYDVLYTHGVVTIGIGDVTGHGLESGLLMLMTQTAVRTLKEVQEQDPIHFLDTLNRTIYKNVQRMNSHRNLTLAVLNYSQGTVSMSGQHEETIFIRQGGLIERIDTIDLGFPIGLDEKITDFIHHTTVELQPGEGIVLYTDGITEAMNLDREQYGIERLCDVLHTHWYQSADEIKEAVISDLRQHIGSQKVFDDITLLVLKRQVAPLELSPQH